MNFNVTFQESKHDFQVSFGEIQTAGDGGYERGYAEGEAAGYEKGHTAGVTEGYGKGYNDGYNEAVPTLEELTATENGEYIPNDGVDGFSKVTVDVAVEDSYYDQFWDANQQKGERTSYYYGYYGSGWTDENFHPKYDIHLDANTFAYCKITDLKRRLEECGVKLDTSVQPNTNSPYSFRQSTVTRLPELDLRTWEHLKYLIFDMPNLISIDKLILKDDGSQQIGGTNGIYKLPELVDIVVEGKFGDSLNLQNSTVLSVDSAKSVILALKNLTGTEDAFGKYIYLHKDVWTALAADTEKAPDGLEWRDYIMSTLCWNT